MLSYSGSLRRRTRKLRNTLALISSADLWPSCTPVRTTWWDALPNFGDLLTLELLPRYGLAPTLHHGTESEFFGIGSLLEHVPADFDGAVWGTGKHREESSVSLPRADVLAVRGALTREALDLPESTPLGDPGLLVSRWIPRRRRRFTAGVIPHIRHAADPWVGELAERMGQDSMIIDVRASPSRVIQQISACDLVLSSSLHGVVVADSYGIPALWDIPLGSMLGGDFKYRDYESAAVPGRSRRASFLALDSLSSAKKLAAAADASTVSALGDVLEEQLEHFRREASPPIRPTRIFLEQFGRGPASRKG